MGALVFVCFFIFSVEAVSALCPKFGALPQFEQEGLKKERVRNFLEENEFCLDMVKRI